MSAKDAAPEDADAAAASPAVCPVLTHFPMCARSRSVRLLAGELGLETTLKEERPWEWRQEFLALNPSGELPVLEMDGGLVLAGAYAISEYLSEWAAASVRSEGNFEPFPGNKKERAEVRRLVDWYHGRMERDVTRELLNEKVYSRLVPGREQPPSPEILGAVRTNLRHHLSYTGHLADQRSWLAGPSLSFADLAAGAHISIADYLGEVPWEEFPTAKLWYQRLKSRPAFRPLLADRLRGMPPPACYADLDF